MLTFQHLQKKSFNSRRSFDLGMSLFNTENLETEIDSERQRLIKIEQSNNELIELALLIRNEALIKGHDDFVKQIDKDLSELYFFQEEFKKERKRLEN
ncbi:hypothetical protein [Thalassobacillus sp. C254]|uniref:hypothetical protein n=1 Tax=Thalassobacillus sp. C254 TaxID=1225341 RepID=UPI0006D049FD|nr:hypothetical protein [Thalassobacillus sp. C254]